jgi:hypothetical protein
LQQLEPVHLGHAVVGEHEIEAVLPGEKRERLPAAIGGGNLMAARLEKRRQMSADILFVVDD